MFLLSLVVTHFYGAMWSPMPKKTIPRMLKLVGLRPGEKLYDLGCGDGRVVLVAAKEFGAEALGVEINPFLYLIARLRCRNLKNVKIVFGNLFEVDFSDADVVVLYLSPSANRRILPKLRRLQGTRIISYRWKLDLPLERKDGLLYFYRV